MEFLHRDEFLEHYREDVQFPAVFVKKGEDITVPITCEEINSLETLDDLMNLVFEKIDVI